MPNSIKNALDEPVISDVIKISCEQAVIDYIQFELIRMSKLVSVGGNLNSAQVEFISKHLVEMFPHETLADFKLCFELGCMGKYGDIFRMDGIVLRGWMEQYLDEKYAIKEAEEKKKYSEVYSDTVQQPEEGEGYKTFKKWAAELAASITNPDVMTDDMIKEQGKEQPVKKKSTGYMPDDAETIIKKELHMQWIKQNFDKEGNKLPGFIDEKEWLKQLED